MKLRKHAKVHIGAIFWGLLITGLILTSIPQTVLADDDDMVLDSETSLDFYLNGIYYYDPGGSAGICAPSGTGSGESISGAEALKEAVKQYGKYAMQLQKEYGSPWEVIFAQMQMESQTGQCTKCVASNVAALGYYNWLGITDPRGAVGDTDPYVSPTGRKWAAFSSIESMMNAWAGPAVLRNGHYDAAFQYTDPDNYNLDAFLRSMIYTYAPPSENDTDGYIEKVKGFINGPINEVREEMGWPTSAEYAKQENIPIGGKVGMEGEIPDDNSNLTAVCGPEAGNLISYVLAYAWPEYHAPNYFDMMPDYAEAVSRRSKEGKYVGGGSHPGIDCGGFVTTLLQDSGFDPEYNIGNGPVSTQYAYITSHNWKVISDVSELQPGDVAINGEKSHTFVYVGEIEGFDSVIASASYSTNGTSWRAPMAGTEDIHGVTWFRKQQE